MDMSSEQTPPSPISQEIILEIGRDVLEKLWDEAEGTFTPEDKHFVSALNRVIINTREIEPENLAALELSQSISLAINTKNEGNYTEQSIEEVITDIFDPKNLPSDDFIPPKNIPFHKATAKPMAEGVRALITNAIALDKESYLAQTDPLTGLLNRRGLDAELERLTGSKDSFVVVMLDIDHFKNVNSTYKHIVGDKALMNFSKMMLGSTRRGDIVSRFGGEEFCIIYKNIPEDVLKQKLEDLRQDIERDLAEDTFSGIKSDGPPIENVTTSMGYVYVGDGKKRHPLSVLEEADKALYHAKETGRNKIVDYQEVEK